MSRRTASLGVRLALLGALSAASLIVAQVLLLQADRVTAADLAWVDELGRLRYRTASIVKGLESELPGPRLESGSRANARSLAADQVAALSMLRHGDSRLGVSAARPAIAREMERLEARWTQTVRAPLNAMARRPEAVSPVTIDSLRVAADDFVAAVDGMMRLHRSVISEELRWYRPAGMAMALLGLLLLVLTVLQVERAVRGIERLRRASRTFVETGTPVRDVLTGSDEIGELGAMVLDITDRVAKLIEREGRFLRHSSSLLAVGGFDGYFKELSPGWTELLGYSVEELLARPWLDFVHPEDLAKTVDVAAELRPDGSEVLRFQNRYVAKDGSVRHLSWNAVTFADDESMYCVAYDLTAQVEAQARMTESELRFRRLLEAAPIGIVSTDESGITLSANPAVVEIFRRSRDEMIGVPLVELLASGSQEELEAARAEHASDPGDGPASVIPLTGRRSDGTEVALGLRFSTTDSAKNESIVIIEDLTEIEELEARVRQAQKADAIGRLAGGVAHDFNNVLTGISLEAELALLSPPEERDTEVAFQAILENARRGSSLTSQLLAISRKQVVQPRVVSVDRLATEMRALLDRLMGGKHEIRLRMGAGPKTVLADPTHIEQIVLNLVVNARDAMEDHGTIVVETSETELVDSSTMHLRPRPGRYVVLSVSDQGVGIPPETMSQIFDPFFTTKAPGEGTGLGLATLFGIVRQSKGGIEVESTPGVGSTFRVYLPAVEAAESAAADEGQEPARGGDELVLLMDDDAALLSQMGRTLTGLGYGVLEASSGAEAAALARSHGERIGVIVSDILMKAETGPSVVQRLHEIVPGVPVIFVSGYADNAYVDHPLVQASSFLPKPFSVAELAAKLRESLDHGPRHGLVGARRSASSESARPSAPTATRSGPGRSPAV